MKLTELGKELRKIRIGREEVLFDMAKKLQMSSAMLSAIETGSKAAPDNFVERLANLYEEVGNDREHFTHLAELTKKQIKLALEDSSLEAKEAACTFARYLPQLTAADLAAISKVLEKYKAPYDKKIKG
ncbi:helix-turn-helix domain-containing protein [Comamonas testosteroni]|uniref:helix-turn-helix domain-containing protein n=1 Tax=Comamonas testosteroni TaxID=285 RepID=UPI0005B51D4F|nr:helix-turn-helix transcriptional regulator [Comamonas testosteroni]